MSIHEELAHVTVEVNRWKPGVGIIKSRATLTNQRGEAAFNLITHFMIKRREPEGSDR